METDPSTEFDHFLAVKLGMTVADLRERMSADEWLNWSIYYQREAQRNQLSGAATPARQRKAKG